MAFIEGTQNCFMFEEIAKNRQQRHYHKVSLMVRHTIQKKPESSKTTIL